MYKVTSCGAWYGGGRICFTRRQQVLQRALRLVLQRALRQVLQRALRLVLQRPLRLVLQALWWQVLLRSLWWLVLTRQRRQVQAQLSPLWVLLQPLW